MAWVGTAVAFYLAALGFATMAWVIYRLRVPQTTQVVRGSAMQNIGEGLRFIRGNSLCAFLMAMTFFNSFFGMAYVTLMPVFAVAILHVGAKGQGVLMGLGGIGALLTTLWLSTRSGTGPQGWRIIGGGILSGLAVAAFALTSAYVGSCPLALGLMLLVGACNTTYAISIQSALQLLVPDHMRGRVMGFYGMTYNLMPVGGMLASALAHWITAPWAVALGGLAVAAFASGPALLHPEVRHLGAQPGRPRGAGPRSTATVDKRLRPLKDGEHGA